MTLRVIVTLMSVSMVFMMMWIVVITDDAACMDDHGCAQWMMLHTQGRCWIMIDG